MHLNRIQSGVVVSQRTAQLLPEIHDFPIITRYAFEAFSFFFSLNAAWIRDIPASLKMVCLYSSAASKSLEPNFYK